MHADATIAEVKAWLNVRLDHWLRYLELVEVSHAQR